ncbi:hypothetical protein DRO66_11525, partial [Candidatus Bathyarchaeota archaeon]
VLELPTAKDGLRAVDTQANARFEFDGQESVNELIRSQGFEGYKFVGGDNPDGVLCPEMQHNSLFLFEPKKLEINGRTEATPDSASDVNFRQHEQPLSEITRDFNDKKSLLTYDAEAEADVAAIGPFKEKETAQDILSEVDEMMEELDYVAADTGTKEFDKLKKSLTEQSPEKYREIAKAADFCVRNL